MNENLHADRVYVIAEMACSHDGSPALAQKIIDGAGGALADAVQFQIWSLKDMAVPHHPDYRLLQSLEIPRKAWRDLAVYARDRYPAMDIIACVYESGSVDFAVSLNVDAFKIHSADLSNPGLLRHVAETGKRIDLCVGASTLTEIQTALDHIRSAGNDQIWLMYGYQSFPTPVEAIHLRYLCKLRMLFELPVCYQDHSDGASEAAFWLPAAALGAGVDALEKHITHDRSLKGADHHAALNPDEFQRFVSMVREIEAAQGLSVPRPFSEAEMRYRIYSKKSIVAGRDLPAGSILTQGDVLFMRADKLGLPPDQADRLLGRNLKRSVPCYGLITEDEVI